LPNILLDAHSKDLSDREREISRGVIARLESLTREDDFLVGEFCRKQTDDIPPAAGPSGLDQIRLSNGGGLGYLAAFRYHLPTRVLLLEKNKMSVSHVRFVLYLKRLEPSCTYTSSEVPSEDVWGRFERGEVRRLSVKIADPENLEAVEPEGAVFRSAAALGDAYSGLTVNIDVGVGHSRDKNLDKGAVRRFVDQVTKGSRAANVTKLKISVADEDGTSLLDFPGDNLKVSDSIDYDGDNIRSKFEARKGFISAAFSDNMLYIQRLYGSGNESRRGSPRGGRN
jgi:hypothetical protein